MRAAEDYARSSSLLCIRGHIDFDWRDDLQLLAADRAKEAVVPAGMTGDTCLLDLDQQRIAVAVDPEIDQFLHMSGSLALAPKRLARSRPVADPTRAHGLGDRITVHPG